MAEIPQWHVAGDWFDVCSCDIACPCIFGQPPTNNTCRGVLAYRIRDGHFGDVTLANLKLVLAATFQGNRPGRQPASRLSSSWIALPARNSRKRCR